MSRSKPYSPTMNSLSRPCEANDFFSRGLPTSDAALCAELARLAYCPQARVRETVANIGDPPCEFFHARGTHAILVSLEARGTSVLAFRGTEPDWQNVLTDARFWKRPWTRGGSVHAGFAEAMLEIWPLIEPVLSTLSGRLLYTGHSLGAALATLAATLHPPDALYTFGSPLIGDLAFTELLVQTSIHRYVNCCDLVCRVPLETLGYAHTGELHYLDSNGDLLAPPTLAAICADQNAARLAFLRNHAWKPGNVQLRDLADHAPVNYVSAFMDEPM